VMPPTSSPRRSVGPPCGRRHRRRRTARRGRCRGSGDGGITIMFNNAGVGGQAPLHKWAPEEWDHLLAVNLTGVYLGFRAAVPHIRAAGGGSIVSTASISGTRPAAGEAPYAAAKAGVAAITASAALEYGPGIRVNSVSPGMILTALTEPLLQFLPMSELDMSGRPHSDASDSPTTLLTSWSSCARTWHVSSPDRTSSSTGA